MLSRLGMEPSTAMLAKDSGNGLVQCLACRRYCKIPVGQAGFCGVRVNDGGKLALSVYGRPCAVHIDPVEKKPLFHFLPGSRSFSIGTFGCNFACTFCFTDATIVNDNSVKSLEEIFESCPERYASRHGEIAYAGDIKTITASGHREKVTKIFRHDYEGDVITIRPRHAPSVTCTPEHRFFVYRDGKFEKIPAEDLKKGDHLAVPKLKPKNERIVLDCAAITGSTISKIKKMRKLDAAGLIKLLELKRAGKTSRQIGAILNMHPVYLRKLLGELKRGGITQATFTYDNYIVREGKRIRYKMETGGGIPASIPLNEELAELLGYYCAEGNTHKVRDRPSSFNVVFSYGRHEGRLVERTVELMERIFQIKPRVLERRTTITVEANGSSLGAFFTSLCGGKAKEKKVPSEMARSDQRMIKAFMDAYLAGDGCVLKDNIAFNTVSKKLALGVYHLLLLLGYLPSFYEWRPPATKIIEGRTVKQSTLYYVKLKAERFRLHFLGDPNPKRRKKSEENLRFGETDTHWLVPVFKIERKRFSGPVYNCEVDNEHSYLANFIAVCNCQNWDISQAPQEARAKDPKKWREYFQRLIAMCEEWPPERVVEEALRSGCKSISFTYNEPTIFTEYAIDVMKLARKKGLKGVYVTNGYESHECWDAIKGHIDAANIDLKAYNKKFYTQLCKVPDYEPVKDSIVYAKKLGFHVEVTTLIIPDWNDDEGELKAEAEFLASVDREMPWHVTAFHPDYKLLDKEPTPPEILIKARELGRMAGLKYVYCGNVSLAYSEYETTSCPSCGKALIERRGYEIVQNGIKNGKCRFCKAVVKGVWK
ncbi:MAG: AmmeMemoRadiSam system radical SAM enzyme [Candidatus Micrarchaeota archaeon]